MPELRYEFSEQGLNEALKALGTTPDAVAANLSALGFTGRLNEPLCCPVANYLRTSVPDAIYACVAKDEDGGLFASLGRGNRVEVDVPSVPAAVQDFILQFDAKLFPGLIDTEEFHGAA